MASVHRRRGSRFWHAAFSLPDGSRRLRSTRETDKAKALQIALMWERAARMRATADQAMTVLADIVKLVSGETLEAITAHRFFELWLARKEREVSPATLEKYRLVVRRLREAIPENMPMAHVSTQVLVRFRDAIADHASIRTANQVVKIVRVIWNAAFVDGYIAVNPGEKLVTMSAKRESAGEAQRRPFRVEEVEAILGSLDPADEWYGMVLFGVYTGARLKDIATARRDQVRDGIWEFRARKTGLRMRVALAMPVLRWLDEHAPAEGALFPTAAAAEQTSTLSGRFYRIMARAGLVPARKNVKQENGQGRAGRRVQSALGFHCFRHTVQTWLMEAGATRDLAMAHVGHEDETTSRGYTHIGVDALRGIVTKLPIVGKKFAKN